MYPERRKRNIQLISDEERERVQQRLHGTDTWGRLEENDEDDFDELEEGEELLLESDDEEVEVEVEDDEWLENEEYEEEETGEIDEIENGSINESRSIKSTNEKQQPKDQSSSVFLIDGQPFVVKEQTKRPTFHESHVRITTYLEVEVYKIVKILVAQRQVENITKLMNKSIKDYLMNRYHNDN